MNMISPDDMVTVRGPLMPVPLAIQADMLVAYTQALFF
jgi:hypothetical protein